MSLIDPTLQYFFILDFEATCDEPQNPKEREIIEFPITLYKRNHGRVSEYREFVRPTINPILSPFCTSLTGIQQTDVDEAATFPSVYPRAAAWIHQMIIRFAMSQGTYIMVTCGDWDLKTQLPKELARHPFVQGHPVFRRWLNLKSIFITHAEFHQKAKNIDWKIHQFDIPDMLAYFDKPLMGKHHSGIDDTRNMATILHELVVTQ